jgi:exodeoxyribonuclease VII small subunit
MTTPRPVEELNYEDAFRELEDVVAALENDEHTLEETLALFARGQMLAKRCETLLDEAELRVQTLSGGELAEFPANP